MELILEKILEIQYFSLEHQIGRFYLAMKGIFPFMRNSYLVKELLRRENKYFYISIVVNIFIHLFIGLIYYNPVDFVLQFEAAKLIAQGRLLYRDIGYIIFNDRLLPNPQYPPLYLYTLAFYIVLIGVNNVSWQLIKLFLLPFSISIGIFVYYTLKDILRDSPNRQKIALWGMNWFLLNPSTLGVIFGGYHEHFMLFWVILGFLFFKSKKYLKSGFFFGLSLLVKPTTIIYIIPLILYMFHEKDKGVVKIGFTSASTFLLGSLPFLILTPKEYIYDVFLVHTTRLDNNMSFYNLFFQELSKTVIPFIIQLLALGICFVLLYRTITFTDYSKVIYAVFPFVALFLLTNRILYPHYLPFLFPFLSINLFVLIEFRKNLYSILGISFGLILFYIGEIVWTLLWMNKFWKTDPLNPLIYISAGTALLGLFIITVLSLITLYKGQLTKDRVII